MDYNRKVKEQLKFNMGNVKFTLILLVLVLMGSYSLHAQSTLAYTDADFHYKNGLEYLNKGVYNAARDEFEEYIRNANDQAKLKDAEYYRAYSALVLYHNDGELLVNDFIANNPTHPKAVLANYELGLFYYNEKNYAKAVTYLSKVGNTSGLDKQKKQEAQFKLAYSYFTTKDFENSLKYFNVIKRQSSAYTPAANYYAGFIEYQLEEYDNAIVDLKKAQEDKAYERAVPEMICKVYYAQEKYDELIAYGVPALSISRVTGKQEIQKFLGEAYFFKSDYSNASKYYADYKASLKRSPEDEIAYRAGYSYFKLGDYETAAEYFKLMASAKTELGILGSYYLGNCYLKLDNARFAVSAFEHVMDSEDPVLREEGTFLYAKVNFELKESSIAVKTFENFLDKYPNSKYSEEANDLLTELYLNGNNYNQAIEHIEKMPSITNSVKDVYQKATFLKGVEYFNSSKFPLAVRTFEKSLQYPVSEAYKVRASYWMAEAYSIGRFYDEATDGYMVVLNSPARSTDGLDVLSYYGLGYAYYNNKVYDQSLVYFKKFIDASDSKSSYYDDALLRLADCNYATRNYSAALQYYRRNLQNVGPETDYALLQTGIISGIEGDEIGAKANLNRVINEYPQSKYWVNAIFELGQLQLQGGNYSEAIGEFSKIIQQRSKSPFTPYALLRRATAYYNQQDYKNVVDNYAYFLDNYPQHAEGNNALLGLQEALSLANRLDEFDAYLTDYKEANPDKEGLEAVEYETAKNQYFNQNYEKAIAGFKAYIDRYPNDVNSFEAKYFIADSYYRMSEMENALKYYYEVYEENKVNQVNRTVQRIAELEFDAANYDAAEKFFRELASLALTRKQEYRAWSGLMSTHYVLARYDSVDIYANLIIEKGLVSANAHTSALVYLGKSAFARGMYDQAKEFFEQTISIALDENAAEAKYRIAEIAANQGDYAGSNEILFDLHSKFSSINYWYDKSFILIADNFVQTEELFQARETLISLIGNSELEEIKQEAQFRLEQVQQMEEAMKPPDIPEDSVLEIQEGGNDQ